MAVLDYPRHFVLLVGAPAVAVVLTLREVGAVSYWLLVRRVWAPFLSRGSLILTIAACEVAMVITRLATAVVPVPRDPLAPALGWLGFSVSLCIADRRRRSSSPREVGHGSVP